MTSGSLISAVLLKTRILQWMVIHNIIHLRINLLRHIYLVGFLHKKVEVKRWSPLLFPSSCLGGLLVMKEIPTGSQ